MARHTKLDEAHPVLPVGAVVRRIRGNDLTGVVVTARNLRPDAMHPAPFYRYRVRWGTGGVESVEVRDRLKLMAVPPAEPFRILETHRSTGRSGYVGAFGDVWTFATEADAQARIDGMRRNPFGGNFERDYRVVRVDT